jgi:hypothetical protein
MWKLTGRKTLYLIISLDVIIIISFLLLYKYKQKYIVNIRQALFSTITAKDDVFIAAPDKLIRVYGFKTEPEPLKKEFYSFIENLEYVRNGSGLIANQKDEIKKAKSIVMLFQKEDEDKQADFPSLLEKIRTMSKANVYGDCSDNAAVFMALGSFFGLTVREVHNTVHVFNEMYSDDLHKWIWIDPENAIMATNEKGEYLSLIEMTQMYIDNKKIDFELFGKNKYPELRKNYFYYYYDKKDKFSYIMMTLGNNIYEVDKYMNRMTFLPKVFGQFIMLIGNIQPHYVIYSGNRDVIIKWNCMKYLSISSICGVILINIAIVPIIFHKRSPKNSQQA